MLMRYFDDFATRYAPYKGGTWCYEDGCLYRGLLLLFQASGEARWGDHLRRLAGAQVAADGSLTGYRIDEYNIDNILAGRVLFALSEATDEPRWRRAADLLARQLESHPRTASGGYFHKKIYPEQVWLDGLYMGLPFQIEYGMRTGQSDLVADAVDQIDKAMDLTRTASGLYVHGHDAAGVQGWADPVTGASPACWARAIGWLAMALVDTIDLAGEPGTTLHAPTEALMRKLSGLRGPEGLWFQVIDMPDLPGNYEESSASAMFAYALMKSERLGLWSGGAAVGADALARLEGRLSQGHFSGICEVAGLGGFGAKYRDGTPAYYLTEPVVCDDVKGVGPLMMATAERILMQQVRQDMAAAQ